jgi:hypothetical protein
MPYEPYTIPQLRNPYHDSPAVIATGKCAVALDGRQLSSRDPLRAHGKTLPFVVYITAGRDLGAALRFRSRKQALAYLKHSYCSR